MTHKVITLEFVIPTVLTIVLGILLSIGAVYLGHHYLAPSINRKPITSSPAATDLLIGRSYPPPSIARYWK
jgi:hypothetical protein